MKHRIAARGLLVENDRVLFIKYKFDDEVFYALPGGAHNLGETLKQCVQREIKEETKMNVAVGECILVNEFMSQPHQLHQVEIIYKVERSNDIVIDAEPFFDPGMEGFHWLSESDMKQVQYYPEKEISWFFDNHSNINGMYFSLIE